MLDRGDARHTDCVAALDSVTTPLVTTLPVLTEAMHLMGRRVGWRGQEALADLVRDRILEVVRLEPEQVEESLQLMRKYRDIPMDLADASLVVLAESRQSKQIFTLDRHFRAYRYRGRHAFDIVPS